MTSATGRVRAFFALWPSAADADAIGAAATLPGRATHPDDLHLTLAFLGSVERTQVESLGRLATGLSSPAFEVVLGALEYWPGAGAWVALAEASPPLLRLHAELAERLRAAGCAPADRRDPGFRPHVTLARAPTGDGAPRGPVRTVAWWASGVTLALTEPAGAGPRYRRLAPAPLRTQ